MNIWNKILVGLLIAVSPVLFYTAMRTLQTYTVWRNSAKGFEKSIAQTQAEILTVAEGTKDNPGIRQLNEKLEILLADRRRVWFKCEPKLPVKIGRADGSAEVTVSIDYLMDTGIAKGTVIHVYETPENAGKYTYLGEFTATSVGNRQVTLAPTGKLNAKDLDQLERAKRPWALYEVLPHDNHEVFASLSDEQKRAMLPAETVQEYLKDGQKAETNDPKDRIAANGEYNRQLRDYDVLFSHERMKSIFLGNEIAVLERDNKMLAEATEAARKEEEACTRDRAVAEADLKERVYEKNAMEALCKSIQKAAEDAQTAINTLLKQNQVMAGQIAKYQLEAVERIDQRTRAMAHTGTGGI